MPSRGRAFGGEPAPHDLACNRFETWIDGYRPGRRGIDPGSRAALQGHLDNYRVARAGYVTPHGPVSAGQIVKFNENPRLIYDLRPNVDVEFVNVNVKTNAEGFRDANHPVEWPAGVRHRVVTLGDSYMFGWGVDVDKGYVSVAAHNLPGWEFIDLALGYNAAQEVECFRVYGLKYKPDIVIINYIGNDTQLPFYIQRTPDDLSGLFPGELDWQAESRRPGHGSHHLSGQG